MNDVKFEIYNYYELLCLHKALLEARFHDNIDNRYVVASPIIAKLHSRIIAKLIIMEIQNKGSENWSEWLQVHKRKDYVEKAVANIYP